MVVVKENNKGELKMNEKIMSLVDKIETWDMESSLELLDMINELRDQLKSENEKIEDYLDFCALPTYEFPEELAGYPVWVVDIDGTALVGDTINEVEPLADIIEFHRKNNS